MATNYTDWSPNVTWQGPKTPGKGGAGALSGATTGATIGSAFGPIGTGVGAVIGGVGGWLLGRRPREVSDAEQLATNWDKLKNAGLQEFGAPAMGGAFQGIGDYSDAVRAWGGQVPGLSDLQGSIGAANSRIGAVGRFKPERIDESRGEEKAYRENVNTNVNPLALRQRKQADQAALMRKGGPASGAQRELLNRQDRQAAEQAIAEQGVGMIEGSMGRSAQLSTAGDQLALSALTSAMQGQISLTQAYSQAAQLGLEGQTAFLSALRQIPGMYAQFLQELSPGPMQYQAAMQGGRGTNWTGLLSDFAGAIAPAFKGPAKLPNMTQPSTGQPYSFSTLAR